MPGLIGEALLRERQEVAAESVEWLLSRLDDSARDRVDHLRIWCSAGGTPLSYRIEYGEHSVAVRSDDHRDFNVSMMIIPCGVDWRDLRQLLLRVLTPASTQRWAMWERAHWERIYKTIGAPSMIRRDSLAILSALNNRFAISERGFSRALDSVIANPTVFGR